MGRGDQIAVRGDIHDAINSLYEHHGVDIGNGYVVHFSSDPSGPDQLLAKCNASICLTTFEEFARGRPVRVVRQCVDEKEADFVVWRAVKSLGQKDYSLIFNNCEHFASWCFSGDSKSSEQVDQIMKGAFSAAASAVLTKYLTTYTPQVLSSLSSLLPGSASSSASSLAVVSASSSTASASLPLTSTIAPLILTTEASAGSVGTGVVVGASSSPFITAAVVSASAVAAAYAAHKAYNYWKGNQIPQPEQLPEQLPEQQLPEQQLPEQQLPEQQLPEQQLPEQQLPEQQLPEQQLPEQLSEQVQPLLPEVSASIRPRPIVQIIRVKYS
eukprot:TRINITY_DN5611_c0_g1_i2.p1 TRINITY_DN5611_c0_g1~~TRINITY_DN5611_c0_g1_i2.p1  ORF type:complete len:327 (+),score=72.49 TRINITY_DN5611_c0_g1_i2:139-1119(+)